MTDLPAKAPPPRTPTREENRRILQAVEEAYHIESKCYRKGHTDKSLGETLKMPWAWVAAIREQMFGPEGNEEVYGIIERYDVIKRDLKAASEAADTRLLELRKESARLAEEGRRVAQSFETMQTRATLEMKGLSDRIDRLQHDMDGMLGRLK